MGSALAGWPGLLKGAGPICARLHRRTISTGGHAASALLRLTPGRIAVFRAEAPPRSMRQPCWLQRPDILNVRPLVEAVGLVLIGYRVRNPFPPTQLTDKPRASRERGCRRWPCR